MRSAQFASVGHLDCSLPVKREERSVGVFEMTRMQKERRSTRGDGDSRGDWYFCGQEVPYRTAVCPASMEEF
jgi:hypothetical protein